jgi:hypothetical protein
MWRMGQDIENSEETIHSQTEGEHDTRRGEYGLPPFFPSVNGNDRRKAEGTPSAEKEVKRT